MLKNIATLKSRSGVNQGHCPLLSPLKVFPWNWIPALGVRELEWWCYLGPGKKFDDIFSCLDAMHHRDWRTDRPTDTGRQQRPRLRIASRGKKHRCKYKWKKRSERRKHCALAVARRSQKFSHRRRPPSRGAQDGQNLISWRWSLPLPTNPVWWRSMHAISSYRGNRPTHKQTHRQDRLQYTAPLSLARSVNQPGTWCLLTLQESHWRQLLISCPSQVQMMISVLSKRYADWCRSVHALQVLNCRVTFYLTCFADCFDYLSPSPFISFTSTLMHAIEMTHTSSPQSIYLSLFAQHDIQ